MSKKEQDNPWERAIDNIDLDQTYPPGSPEYHRISGNILEDQLEITRRIAKLRWRKDRVLEILGNAYIETPEINEEINNLTEEYEQISKERERITKDSDS